MHTLNDNVESFKINVWSTRRLMNIFYWKYYSLNVYYINLSILLKLMPYIHLSSNSLKNFPFLTWKFFTALWRVKILMSFFGNVCPFKGPLDCCTNKPLLSLHTFLRIPADHRSHRVGCEDMDVSNNSFVYTENNIPVVLFKLRFWNGPLHKLKE